MASPFAGQARLLGRRAEMDALLDSLEAGARGNGSIHLIPGASGAGKTALARTLREPTWDRNGIFLEGKFNQYDRNIPYVAWRQALTQFCEYVAREDESRQQKWRAEILQAVRGQGQLLIDLAPGFERLLGSQTPVDVIGAQESRHRFADVLRALFGVISKPEHPLVLFIDDWQWADAASLYLLNQLEIGEGLRYLLLVAAYRDNEVDQHHPLLRFVTDLQRRGTTVELTKADNLGVDDIRSLVREVVEDRGDGAETLASVIHRKSGGNPFFANSLVEWTRLNGASWPRGEDEIERQLPDDVVGLFAQRMNQLESRQERLLRLAACMGSRFRLDRLALVSDLTVEDCQQMLAPLTDLVTAVSDYQGKDRYGEQGEQWYQFAHDRVQQAAYSRISAEEMSEIRLGIARKKLAALSREEMSERVCEVAEHFNAGLAGVVCDDERIEGVKLNIAAARKARGATAFRAALQYHRVASSQLKDWDLEERFWREHHASATELFLGRAESEFLEGEKAEAERCVRNAVVHANSPIQRAEALITLIVQSTLQAKYADAIAIGREALEELDVALPTEDYAASRDLEIARMRNLLGDQFAADIIDLPVALDPRIRVAAKVLITMGPPCYRAHQDLWSVIVPRVVNLTLQHGNLPQVGYSHTALTGLLAWVANDFSTGRMFSEIATRLMSGSLASSSDKSVFHLMIGSSVRHWQHHLRESSEDYLAAILAGQQSGNLQYAAYAYAHNMYCRFFQGTELSELLIESESSLQFSRNRHNQWAVDVLEGGLRVFTSLHESVAAPEIEREWEAQYLAEVEQRQNHQVSCIYHVIRAQQCLVMGWSQQAERHVQQAAPLIPSVGTQGLLPWAEFVFARVLSMMAGDEWTERQRVQVEKDLQQLQIWAETSPENFAHKHLLASAEYARLEGRFAEAIHRYDQAIDAARESGFIQWEALANELAGRFWNRCGDGRLEQVYWQRSYECYERWGANAKLQAMAEQFEQSCTHASASALKQATQPPTDAEDLSRTGFAQRQTQLLRTQAEERAEMLRQAKSALQADELADAAETLRADLAAGRRTTRQLREQRDAQKNQNEELEQRVNARTEELRKLTERLQRANDSLQQSNDDLEKFAYVASHDLQEPLRKITAYAQLVEMESKDSLNDDSQRYLATVIDGALRLRTLVTELLAFSRINTTGKQPTSTAAERSLREAIDRLELTLEENEAEVTWDDLPTLTVDDGQLTLVFQNLISNALKYRSEASPRIHVSASELEHDYEFVVSDNGIGIEPEYYSKIFEIFQRLHGRGVWGGGTGIGLAMCKRVVTRFGGRIWVESEVGSGSRFHFTISKTFDVRSLTDM